MYDYIEFIVYVVELLFSSRGNSFLVNSRVLWTLNDLKMSGNRSGESAKDNGDNADKIVRLKSDDNPR